MRKLIYILIGSAFISFLFTTNIIAQTEEIPQLLTEIQTEIQSVLNKLDKDLSFAANLLAEEDFNSSRTREILLKLCKDNPEVVDSCIVDTKGRMIVVEPKEYKNVEGKYIGKQEQIIRLHKNHTPVLSKIISAVEGFDAVDLEYPIFSSKKEFRGSVSILIRHSYFIEKIVKPIIAGMPVEVWGMQTDGVIVYDADSYEIGKNLFTDELYKPYGDLIKLGERMIKEKKGTGLYKFYKQGEKKEVLKYTYWATVDLHSTEWRIVLVHAEADNKVK